MVDSIKSGFNEARAAYTDQIQRNAWREDMLQQALAKVRELKPAVKMESTPAASSTPLKGRLINIYA